ncbi:MAG: LacI family DNA-binding transcriptional regulator [Bacteroidota bacterium]
MKRTTIKDIAQILQVAPSTVSRALVDHPDISDATKKRVQEIAQTLKYAPNLKTRYLGPQLSGLVALILPEVNAFFSPALMRGINCIVEQKGYSLVVLPSDNEPAREKLLLKYCANLQVEGILLSVCTETQNLDHLQVARDAKIPIALLNRICESIMYSSISIDGEAASYRAVNFLIKKGRKRIAGIFSDSNLRISRARAAGFRRALAEAGLAPYGLLSISDMNHFEPEWDDFHQKTRLPDAYFAMSDELMVRTHYQISRMGRQMPQDCALISISDGEAPYYLYPNVTHIHHSGQQVGVRAAKMLFNLISDFQDMVLEAKFSTPLVELSSV